MLMKLGGFKNNEYLIRHKLKGINTVGSNVMKLISLSLPLPTSPLSKRGSFRSCGDAYRSLLALLLVEA